MDRLDQPVVRSVSPSPALLARRETVEERRDEAEVLILRLVGGRTARGWRRLPTGEAGVGASGYSLARHAQHHQWSRPDRSLLPPRELVPKPDPDDPVDYYYKPLTARIYRARLRLAARSARAEPHDSMIEVGYGSGIFLPELARRTRPAGGHRLAPRVRRGSDEMLTTLGLDGRPPRGVAVRDAVRRREFERARVPQRPRAHRRARRRADEFRRVLEPGGVAVLGFPVRNPITDTFFRAVGYNPREIHPSSHQDVLARRPTASGHSLSSARSATRDGRR